MRRTFVKYSYYDIPDNAKPVTRWLLNLMNEYELNHSKLAKKIHVSRQAVANWVNGTTKISYSNICAICRSIDINANPDDLYKMFNKEA